MQAHQEDQQEGSNDDDVTGDGTRPSGEAAGSWGSSPNGGAKRATSQRSANGSQGRGGSRGSSRGGGSSQVQPAGSIFRHDIDV